MLLQYSENQIGTKTKRFLTGVRCYNFKREKERRAEMGARDLIFITIFLTTFFLFSVQSANSSNEEPAKGAGFYSRSNSTISALLAIV